jgi:hypothetical protein
MTLRSPSRISSILPSGPPDRSRTTGSVFQTTSPEVLAPLRRSQHEESTSRSLAPARASVPAPRSDRNHTASPTRRRRSGIRGPRRGLPHPLRSAFAVSHDLDGLLLLVPCDVFRSHTPMGFAFPVSLEFLACGASLRLSVAARGQRERRGSTSRHGLPWLRSRRVRHVAVVDRSASLPTEVNSSCAAASDHPTGRRFGSKDPSLELMRVYVRHMLDHRSIR